MTPAFARESRALLTLGLPLIGSNLAQFAMGLTDAVMLGWYDVEALAAVTLANTFYFVVFILGSGFAWAVMPMVAEAVEAGDTTRARRVTRMGIWLSVAYGLVMTLAFLTTETLFRAIGQAEVVAVRGQDYIEIAGWQLVPALCVIVLRSFLSALELTRIILWVTLFVAVLNVPLNYVLIFGGPFGLPSLGERGAAIATLSMSLLSLVFLLVYTVRKARDYNLFQRLWRIDTGAMSEVARIGTPIGLTSLAEVGLFAGSSVMMGWFGPVPLAAHGIALQLASVVFVVHLGLSQAVTVRAGRALGRRDEASLRLSARVALIQSAIFACCTVVLFVLFPEFLVSLFVDPSDPARDEILAIGTALLGVAAVFQFVDGGQVIVLGVLRGVLDTRIPLVMAAVSYWGIGLPVAYGFGFGLELGGVGVWAGLVVGLAAAFGLLTWRFYNGAAQISPRAGPET